jgi:hypothetical protein
MSDLKKLAKAVEKAQEVANARRAEVDEALTRLTDAAGALAVAREAFEEAEVLEAAKELRKAK